MKEGNKMKRFSLFYAILSVLLIVSTCILPAAATVAQGTDDNLVYYHGDLNGNGEIDKFDYIVIKRHCMKTISLNEEQLLRGDINQNGEIEKFDYILVKRHVMKTYAIPMVSSSCKHALELVAAKEATCTEDGNIAYYDCKNCDKLFSDENAENEIAISSTVIPENGHTEVIDKAVEPTCSAIGLTEGKHCSECNAVITAQKEIGKLNHTPNDPTCTEDQICTVCKEVIKSAQGHIAGVDATCTEDQICTVCQAVLKEATDHSLKYVPEKPFVDANDPGNCAYWQCENCKKCYLDEKANNEIAIEDTVGKFFKITYFCDENNTKQTIWYKVGAEIEDLLIPEIDGYNFKYWQDGYGKRVNSIPANNTENIELYAVVELETYTIYFGGTWKYDNVTYTVKDQVDLHIPVEDGLTFGGWRDSEGRVEAYTDSVGIQRWRIPKGTTGDVELMAQWKDNRNLVVPDTRTAENRYVSSGYDEAEKCYWFVYSLGEIRNVVLDPESTLVKTKHSGGHIAGSLTLAETVSVEESVGKSVSETVSHTVTNSTNWEMTNDWEQSSSAGVEVSVMVGAEIGPEFAKSKVETSIGVSCEISASVGGSITEGGSGEESDENSNTIETNFAYNKAISQSKDRNISFTHDVAPGNYYYANVGTVKVYAFVVFDPVTNTFGLETFSVLDEDTSTAVLCDKKDGREYVSDALSYDVYIDGINNEVNGNFFVQYFANNGTNESVVKMYPRDTDVKLASNPFAYTGYTFDKWTDATGTDYTEGKTVKNLAGAGQMLVMNAQWNANKYTVKYEANKPSNASNDVTNMPTSIDAIYDTSVTLGQAPSLIGWTFDGWYLDAACTNKVGKGNETVEKANLASAANGTATLFAKWKARTYTVVYSANGGNGVVNNTTHTYDSASALASGGYTKTNYTLIGWSTDAKATTPMYKLGQAVTDVTPNSTVMLYAVWVKSYTTVNYVGRSIELIKGHSHTDNAYPEFDRDTLIQSGFKTLDVTISVDAKENAWIVYNQPILEIYANGKRLAYIDWGTFYNTSIFGNDWASATKSATLNLSDLDERCTLVFKWSAANNIGGSGDGFYLGSTYLSFYAK